MFVSAGQFYYFAECLFIGALSGLISEILLVSVPLSSKFGAVEKITDFLRFAVACVVYFRLSLYFRFPDVRLYMPFGVIVGNALEYVTVHKLLAKHLKTWYNKFENYLRSKINDRKKNAKARYGRHGSRRRRAVSDDSGSDCSDVRIICKKKTIAISKRKTDSGGKRFGRRKNASFL